MPDPDASMAHPDTEALLLASTTLMESLDVLQAVALIADGRIYELVPDLHLTSEQQLTLITKLVHDYLGEADTSRELLVLLTG